MNERVKIIYLTFFFVAIDLLLWVFLLFLLGAFK